MPKKPFRDLSGMRFERLTVSGYAGRSKYGNHQWFCRCDCGTEKTCPDYQLLAGRIKSCGCYRIERGRMLAAEGGTAVVATHRMHGTPTYSVWLSMKRRCNRSHSTPNRYAVMGIQVCEQWQTSFDAFLRDMGERPTPNHSIERIDNSRGYEPANCRWATDLEQGANKRNNHVIECRGERKHLAEWARCVGIHPSTLRLRLLNNWSVEDALFRPVARIRRHLL